MILKPCAKNYKYDLAAIALPLCFAGGSLWWEQHQFPSLCIRVADCVDALDETQVKGQAVRLRIVLRSFMNRVWGRFVQVERLPGLPNRIVVVTTKRLQNHRKSLYFVKVCTLCKPFTPGVNH